MRIDKKVTRSATMKKSDFVYARHLPAVAPIAWTILLIVMTALAALSEISPASAGEAEIEHECTTIYPNITQYFAWKDCVKTEEQRADKEKQKELKQAEKREREERARPCIARDLSRMERLAAKARAAIKPTFSLENAQTVLARILDDKGEIAIPKDNIKERVLVFSIGTTCDSSFHFLINVRADKNGTLRWYSTWAEHAPVGYKEGHLSQFSSQFELERMRAQQKKASQDAERQAERQREKERQKTLSGIQISNTRIRCSSTCSFATLEFNVTNTSENPLTDVSFGWALPSNYIPSCPKNLATNDGLSGVLQPGQTVKHTIFVGELPEAGMRICVKVTGARAPYAWEK